MIKLSKLEKVIDGHTFIQIDDLTVNSGETTALVGPVGSGKQVLVDLLIGKSRPTTGTVRLSEIDPLFRCPAGIFPSTRHRQRVCRVTFNSSSTI